MEGLCGWILLKKSKLITRTREVIQSLSSDGICGSSIKTIWRTCQRLSGQQDVDLTAFKCHEIIAHLIIFDQLNIFFFCINPDKPSPIRSIIFLSHNFFC